MDKEALLALAAKWQRDAKPPENQSENPEYALGNATDKGFRLGLKSAADDLVVLIKLLGD